MLRNLWVSKLEERRLALLFDNSKHKEYGQIQVQETFVSSSLENEC